MKTTQDAIDQLIDARSACCGYRANDDYARLLLQRGVTPTFYEQVTALAAHAVALDVDLQWGSLGGFRNDRLALAAKRLVGACDGAMNFDARADEVLPWLVILAGDTHGQRTDDLLDDVDAWRTWLQVWSQTLGPRAGLLHAAGLSLIEAQDWMHDRPDDDQGLLLLAALNGYTLPGSMGR